MRLAEWLRYSLLAVLMLALLAGCAQPGARRSDESTGATEPTAAAEEEPAAAEPTEMTEEAATEAPAAAEEEEPASSESGTLAGDAAAGEVIFKKQELSANGETAAGCITCHTVGVGEPDLLGPNQSDIALRAEENDQGQTPEEYLRTAILMPDEYVVEGWPPGTMPQNFGDILSDEEIDQLIAYLQTLDQE
ncbi:MAG: c-type cytochrome [Chloroflexaceae bacterium]|nr:c-type cytochrome [Chloroflexaceae bacterium]